MKHVAICIVATRSYFSTMDAVTRRVLAAINSVTDCKHTIIVVSDQSEEAVNGMKIVTDRFSKNPEVGVIHRKVSLEERGAPYKEDRQNLIASLQSIAFDEARTFNPDYLWSIEADVLVPPNSLLCSLQMLEFDNSYYDVAFVTYPSQSGSGFLGGRGSYQRHILEDFYLDERVVPKELKREYDSFLREEKKFQEKREQPPVEWVENFSKVVKKIEECPPKANVHSLNGEMWRPRGWLENAYPAVGRGAVLPTDWTGLGCTLMSKKALNLAHFEGYDGKGTQDLFLNWRRWAPEGLKFCVITHTLCEHVVRDSETGRHVHCFAHHEPEGQYKGHLRVTHKPFISFDETLQK